ncbi:HK97 gp10 family phage protein [Sphingomonas sp. VNH70]|uniref:HK97 gp10 family phage protein n=1 Tax=Sphingomonas silueang TaxID=3156617 RepID=UPI0032B39238
MKVRIEGTDAIARKIKAMGQALTRKTLVPIMAEELQPMADEMRGGAARRSGEMADSVTVSTKLSPAQAAANVPIAPVEVFAGPGPLPQAIQEEFGNVHQTADPFIRPAFDSQVQSTMKRIGQRGIEAILDAGKKG